ncbi:MAG: hypothetical protein AAF772_17710, partial [Acidobacteriota bacterium]
MAGARDAVLPGRAGGVRPARGPLARWRRGASRRRNDGLGLTRIGIWFLIFGVLLLVAATNTGNNGLYLTIAAMGGMLLMA